MPGVAAVTGAAGFIGGAVCARLRRDGWRVVGVDRLAAGPGDEFRRAELTDPRAARAALAGCSHVVHTAARATDFGPMDLFVQINVEGTRNVLDAAQAAGAERVVHLSSVAVWGYDFASDLLDEDAPPQPCGVPYIDTKGTSELLALARGATVVRPGDVYGPGSIPWLVRPLDAIRRGLFRLPGGGSGVMTPVYVDDLVDGIARALTAPQAAGRAYTCWDGERVAARDFFAHHARMLGRERVPTGPRPLLAAGAAVLERAARRTGSDPVITPNALVFVSRRAAYPNARIREELGWSPEVPLAEGMRRAAAWARQAGLA